MGGDGCGSPALAWELSAVKRLMQSSLIVVNFLNCSIHCSTATPPVHSTMQLFLMMLQQAMPVSVLPAPHGSTITPERARPLPPLSKILLRLFFW